jgi:ubiquinone/menaquinone biosynthesis C-methylase UbiE
MRGARAVLYKLYWKAEKLIVPGLRSSQYAYYETLRARLNDRPRWLDLGCGHQVFADWMLLEQAEVMSRARPVVGLDYDHQSLRKHTALSCKVAGDLRRLPFPDGSFDLATANMVVEHLEDPAACLAEIRRILRPNGAFVFHTPNFLNHLVFLSSWIPGALKRKLVEFVEGRKEQDVFPTWYRLNTPGAIQRLARNAGFELRELKLVSTSAAFVMLGPVVILELLVIRLLGWRALEKFRTNIITILEKPDLSS